MLFSHFILLSLASSSLSAPLSTVTTEIKATLTYPNFFAIEQSLRDLTKTTNEILAFNGGPEEAADLEATVNDSLLNMQDFALNLKDNTNILDSASSKVVNVLPSVITQIQAAMNALATKQPLFQSSKNLGANGWPIMQQAYQVAMNLITASEQALPSEDAQRLHRASDAAISSIKEIRNRLYVANAPPFQPSIPLPIPAPYVASPPAINAIPSYVTISAPSPTQQSVSLSLQGSQPVPSPGYSVYSPGMYMNMGSQGSQVPPTFDGYRPAGFQN